MAKLYFMLNGLLFEPWISEKFKLGKGKFGRLLILGESHYSDHYKTYDETQKDLEENELENSHSSRSTFTIEIVNEFLYENENIPFFRNLGLLFNQDDRFEVWENVAFSNAIQVMLNKSNAQPSIANINTIKDSFWALLTELKPDKILVCSQRMWNYWLPDSDERGYLLQHLDCDGKHSTIWKYQFGDVKSFAMAINHPSKFFSYKKWRPLVMKFLNTAFE